MRNTEVTRQLPDAIVRYMASRDCTGWTMPRIVEVYSLGHGWQTLDVLFQRAATVENIDELRRRGFAMFAIEVGDRNGHELRADFSVRESQTISTDEMRRAWS